MPMLLSTPRPNQALTGGGLLEPASTQGRILAPPHASVNFRFAASNRDGSNFKGTGTLPAVRCKLVA